MSHIRTYESERLAPKLNDTTNMSGTTSINIHNFALIYSHGEKVGMPVGKVFAAVGIVVRSPAFLL
jgi:hypothetical protein